jgi:hypothetical protein
MHPSGIKFGLSQGLLELSGADVVASRRSLENLSEMARRKIRRRKRVMCIWEEVLASGLRRTPYSLTGVPRQEFVPFYTGFERIVLQTMMPIAEQVRMGRRFGPRHFLAEGLLERLNKDTRRYYARTSNEAWRVRFRQIYCTVIQLCREHAPEYRCHAELLALCQFNNWQTDRENRKIAKFLDSLLHGHFDEA